jgi:TonB family protein
VQKIGPKVGLLSSGVPTAILDNQAKGTENFATREDMQKSLQDPEFEGEGAYGGGSPGIQSIDERIPPSDTFIPYEEAPVMVKEVKPTYPELARRSGVEGRVYVQVWIDRRGKVKDAKCRREGSINLDIFCESALQAARQNEYKPAISNKVPVPCWVTYKVDFVLR